MSNFRLVQTSRKHSNGPSILLAIAATQQFVAGRSVTDLKEPLNWPNSQLCKHTYTENLVINEFDGKICFFFTIVLIFVWLYRELFYSYSVNKERYLVIICHLWEEAETYFFRHNFCCKADSVIYCILLNNLQQ